MVLDLLTHLTTGCPQIAKKVGCPMDDTARMAKCFKVTDPKALTLAYKMPLADMECEWGSCMSGGNGRGKTLLQVQGTSVTPAPPHVRVLLTRDAGGSGPCVHSSHVHTMLFAHTAQGFRHPSQGLDSRLAAQHMGGHSPRIRAVTRQLGSAEENLKCS